MLRSLGFGWRGKSVGRGREEEKKGKVEGKGFVGT